MNKQFSKLMSPGKIGNVEIPNRIVAVPIGAAMATSDGLVTDRMLAYYAEKAKGGTGLIIVEATYIDEIVSKGEESQLGAYSGACGPGLALLATVMHDHGVKCGVQLCHIGEQMYLHEKYWSAAPSDGVEDMGGMLEEIQLRGLTKEEIHGIIKSFAKAAWRVKMAGFDMVEIHAAHGHLLSTFLSEAYNRRTDEYGGSLENRMRIIVEIVQAVQKEVGSHFPILVRMVGQDRQLDNPITIEESIEVAKKLEEIGVAAIDLSGGSNLNQFVTPPTYEERGVHVPDALALKEAGVTIPIIVAGGITTPDLAEEILSQGQTDFVGLGRPILADPYWAKKIEAGAPEDIVPCIRCGMDCIGTLETFMAARGVRCAVNPRCGLEQIRKVAPLVDKKKVAIIGGGVAGMEAARLATLRGHDVTVYEKRKLGGVLHEAGWDTDLKPDIQFLLDYYLTQIEKLKVPVKYEEASVEEIGNTGYDVAIVATGAIPREYKVPGYDKPHVYTDLEVTGGKDQELGDTVIVVGDGDVAAEIAISQAMKGKEVIMNVFKKDPMKIAENAASPNFIALMFKLMTLGIEINTGMRMVEITDTGIISVDRESGGKLEFVGDSVVICAGYLPDRAFADALKDKMKDVRAIGDCIQPRLIGDAIREGWLAANQI